MTTLIAIIGAFPALNGAATITTELLNTVVGFLCKSYVAAGGAEAAIAPKGTMKMTMEDKTVAEIHGIVWDPKQGKFVSF